MTLVVTQTIIAFTRGLSVKLQGQYVDVSNAHSNIELVKTALKAARSQGNRFHERTFAEAVHLAASVGSEQSSLHLGGRQQHCSNVPSSTPSDY